MRVCAERSRCIESDDPGEGRSGAIEKARYGKGSRGVCAREGGCRVELSGRIMKQTDGKGKHTSSIALHIKVQGCYRRSESPTALHPSLSRGRT